ncbi:MAG: hypothetical protein QM778_19535 [Myxococcales bacterium]
MPVSEGVVAEVVADISERMKDPNFAQLSVGSFVENQPHISRFLSAKANRLGGAQALMELVFHAEVLRECLARAAGGRDVPEVGFPVLDKASQGDFKAAFTQREPHLANYVASNIDQEGQRAELCRVGLALCMAMGS